MGLGPPGLQELFLHQNGHRLRSVHLIKYFKPENNDEPNVKATLKAITGRAE